MLKIHWCFLVISSMHLQSAVCTQEPPIGHGRYPRYAYRTNHQSYPGSPMFLNSPMSMSYPGSGMASPLASQLEECITGDIVCPDYCIMEDEWGCKYCPCGPANGMAPPVMDSGPDEPREKEHECLGTILCMLSCKDGYQLGPKKESGCQTCTCKKKEDTKKNETTAMMSHSTTASPGGDKGCQWPLCMGGSKPNGGPGAGSAMSSLPIGGGMGAGGSIPGVDCMGPACSAKNGMHGAPGSVPFAVPTTMAPHTGIATPRVPTPAPLVCPVQDQCRKTCKYTVKLGPRLPDGCRLCTCIEPVTEAPTVVQLVPVISLARRPCVELEHCRHTCRHGFEVESSRIDACPVCRCIIPIGHDEATPAPLPTRKPPTAFTSVLRVCPDSVHCMKTCTSGYTLTTLPEGGCPICTCNRAPKVILLCEQPLACPNGCTVGYKCDNEGCPTCSCVAPTETSVSLHVQTITTQVALRCSPRFSCVDKCAFGYKTGDNGCPTCVCLQPVTGIIEHSGIEGCIGPECSASHAVPPDISHTSGGTLHQVIPGQLPVGSAQTSVLVPVSGSAQVAPLGSMSGTVHGSNLNTVPGISQLVDTTGPVPGSGQGSNTGSMNTLGIVSGNAMGTGNQNTVSGSANGNSVTTAVSGSNPDRAPCSGRQCTPIQAGASVALHGNTHTGQVIPPTPQSSGNTVPVGHSQETHGAGTVQTVSLCPDQLSCPMGCTVGYKCDQNGCPSCTCILPSETSQRVDVQSIIVHEMLSCSGQFSCMDKCVFGYRTGPGNCPSCNCLQPVLGHEAKPDRHTEQPAVTPAPDTFTRPPQVHQQYLSAVTQMTVPPVIAPDGIGCLGPTCPTNQQLGQNGNTFFSAIDHSHETGTGHQVVTTSKPQIVPVIPLTETTDNPTLGLGLLKPINHDGSTSTTHQLPNANIGVGNPGNVVNGGSIVPQVIHVLPGGIGTTNNGVHTNQVGTVHGAPHVFPDGVGTSSSGVHSFQVGTVHGTPHVLPDGFGSTGSQVVQVLPGGVGLTNGGANSNQVGGNHVDVVDGSGSAVPQLIPDGIGTDPSGAHSNQAHIVVGGGSSVPGVVQVVRPASNGGVNSNQPRPANTDGINSNHVLVPVGNAGGMPVTPPTVAPTIGALSALESCPETVQCMVDCAGQYTLTQMPQETCPHCKCKDKDCSGPSCAVPGGPDVTQVETSTPSPGQCVAILHCVMTCTSGYSIGEYGKDGCPSCQCLQ